MPRVNFVKVIIFANCLFFFYIDFDLLRLRSATTAQSAVTLSKVGEYLLLTPYKFLADLRKVKFIFKQ